MVYTRTIIFRENEMNEISRDFDTQMNHPIQTRVPNLVTIIQNKRI